MREKTIKALKTIVILLFSILLFIIIANLFAYIAALLGIFGSAPLMTMGLPEFSLFEVGPEAQMMVSMLIFLLSALLAYIAFAKLMKRFVV